MFKSKNENNVVYKCTIRLLEDADIIECEFQNCHKASYLVDFICEQLKIKEKDYFGLRYVDASKQRHWLDLSKIIIKQCKDVDLFLFSFRVKFYPADPFRLTGNARIMLYQQLKRDLRHGRLYCSLGEAAALGSLIIQEELGDYDETRHTGDYVSSMNVALRQTELLQKKIMELHKKRKPFQDPSAAMDEFMGIARGLETYGIDPHPVKDHRGSPLYIGINHSGISTFVSGKKFQHFRWNEVHKLNFEGKMFIAHLSYTDASREPKKHTIGFKCTSNIACRYLWRCAIEQMLFFTLPNSQHASVVTGGGFFSWGTKFKYTGRTEREILTESITALREQKMTNSSASKRKANSVPATPSSPEGNTTQIRYSSLPRSTMSEPLGSSHITSVNGFGSISYNTHPHETYIASMPMSNLEPVSEEERLRTSSNLNNLAQGGSGEMMDYYLKDDAVDYSSFDYGRDCKLPDRGDIYRSNENNILSSHSSYFLQQQHQQQQHPHLLENACANRNPNEPSNSLKTSVDKQFERPNSDNCAKGVRKFNFFNAFIPSFIFVILTMAVSAIIILESEIEILERIRNMPEMISLRYQYYQPLKEYMIRKLSRWP